MPQGARRDVAHLLAGLNKEPGLVQCVHWPTTNTKKWVLQGAVLSQSLATCLKNSLLPSLWVSVGAGILTSQWCCEDYFLSIVSDNTASVVWLRCRSTTQAFSGAFAFSLNSAGWKYIFRLAFLSPCNTSGSDCCAVLENSPRSLWMWSQMIMKYC